MIYMTEKLIEKAELNEEALEKVNGGFNYLANSDGTVSNSREVDPNSFCPFYVCSICGGKRYAHLGNCSHSRLNYCGSCAYVKRNNGIWSCNSSSEFNLKNNSK